MLHDQPSSHPDEQDERASESPSPEPPPSKESVQRPPPKEALPTERIAFTKQLELLRAYAAVSDEGNSTVTNDDVAKIVSMKASTVSLANNFFVKIGFLTKSGRAYIPTKEVLEFQRAQVWQSDTAPHKLAPIVERAWFAQALRPTLQFRSIDENAAVTELAQRAGVDPTYRAQLRTLLDYMEAAGIIRRDNGQIALVPHAAGTQQVTEPQIPKHQQEKPPLNQQSQTGVEGRGAVQFNVNVNVSLDEISKWTPDRITAFFAGLAQVLSARRGDG